MRGFKAVSRKFLKAHEDGRQVMLPRRATIGSAAYDFFLPKSYCIGKTGKSIRIPPGDKFMIWTDVKAYMMEDEALFMFIRSGLSVKQNLQLINSVGIVDSDYFGNSDNDGNIGVKLYNTGDEEVIIPLTDKNGYRMRIAQGVFMPYLLADNDSVSKEREGGHGSTSPIS